MRKEISLLSLTVVVIFSCNKSPLSIAKQEVIRIIKQNLSNPGNYKAVSWGTLDTAFAEPLDITSNEKKERVYLDPVEAGWYKLRPEKIYNIKEKDCIQGVEGRWYFLNYTDVGRKGKSKFTINQFAYLVKRKYLEYRDLSNSDVLRQMLKEHPVYKSQVDTSDLDKESLKWIIIGHTIEHTFLVRVSKDKTKIVKWLFTLDPEYKYISMVEKDIKALDE